MNPVLTWYGHSCFRLDLNTAGNVVFDPYESGSVPGVELPEGLTADMVICSHEHGDHNASGRVHLTGRHPSFSVSSIDTFHDPEGGRLRGRNRISIVQDGTFRAAHLGDLGCPLTEEQIRSLKNLDLLMIPVGGFFTIGPAEAKTIVNALKPRIIVPMHYRRGNTGYPVISALDDFTSLFSRYTETGNGCLELTPELEGIYVLSV